MQRPIKVQTARGQFYILDRIQEPIWVSSEQAVRGTSGMLGARTVFGYGRKYALDALAV